MSTEPFPGLRPFRRDEADIFFGRESVIDEMVSRLAAHRFLAVTGTSGSGKSSLVFTGLLDALELGLLARAGSDWTIAQCRPGNRPLRALAESLIEATEAPRFEHDSLLLEAALSRGPAGLFQWLAEAHLPPRNNLLLVVDQFEELFRYRGVEIADTGSADLSEARQRQAWEAAAGGFVDVLVGAAAEPDRRIYVVLTMRSDYLGECAQFAGLAEAINRGQFLTPRLTREQLADAVAGPVKVFGGAIEPALINRVLNEMGNDPDQLPLMQHAMMRMWRRAKAEQTGPVRLTEADYDAWIASLKVALSAHATEVLDSLSAEDQALAQILFRSLTEGSTIADARRHPITLREAAAVAEVEPERLEPIVETFRAPGCDFLTPATGPLEPDTTIDIAHESLIRQWDNLREWMGDEFASAALWRRLSSAAADWENKKASPWVSPDLENALAWRERQAPTEAWVRRYGGNLAQAFRFLRASQRAARWRWLGGPVFLTAASVFLLIAVIAVFQAYMAGKARQAAEVAEQAAEVDRQTAEAASQKLYEKEQQLAAMSAQQSIHARVRAAQPEDLDLARQFALRALGMLPADPTTRVYQQLMHVLRSAYAIDYNARLLIGSQDAKFLIIDAHGVRAAAVTGSGAVALWNVATGLPGPHLSSDSESSTALAFSRDGAFLATAGDTISIWNAASGEELAHFTDQISAEVSDLAVSLDGKRILSLDKNGNAELWDVDSKSKLTPIECPVDASGEQSDNGSGTSHVALRDDGKAGLVSWPDGRVALWREAANPPKCETHDRAASFVMFDGDDPVVILDKPESLADSLPASFSGVTILGRLGTPVGFDGWTDFTANAGGHWAFQAISADGGIALARDISGSQNAPAYAFTLCVDCNYAGVTRGDVRAVAHALNSPRTAAAIGDTVTVSGGDQPSKPYKFPETSLQRVAISPDGETIAAIADDAGWVWRKDDAAPKALDGLHLPHSVAFSPDGKYLVTADGSYQNTVTIWNLEADPPTATRLMGHSDDVRDALFLANDRIVSASDDKTVRFWQLTNPNQQTGTENQTPGTTIGEQNAPPPAPGRTASQSEKAAAQALQWEEEPDRQIKISSETENLVSLSFDKTNGRLAVLGSSGRVYLVDLNADTKQDPRPVWLSARAAEAIGFTPDGSKLVIVARGADDEASLVAGGVQLVALPVPGAVLDLSDAKPSSEDDPTFPYRGGVAFEDDSHILLATAEGLLRADLSRPPKFKGAPSVTDRELIQLSDLLIAHRRSPQELDRIGNSEDVDNPAELNAAEQPCSDDIEPCLKAVRDHPGDPEAWRQLAASRQSDGSLQSAAELVGAMEGDPGLAEKFVGRLSGVKSLGPALKHWFLLGMFRPDQPISAALVTELFATGSPTPAERASLQTMFEARAARQDAGANAALALLDLQSSPAADATKQALKHLLIAERLEPGQSGDLIRSVLRANLVRAFAPADVLTIQAAAASPAPSSVAPGQPAAPAWSPDLNDIDLHTGLGQLNLFEAAFERLREKWPAEPKLDLLEALVRVELAAELLGSRSSDEQTRVAARETLTKALRQLGPWQESLSDATADAGAMVGDASPVSLKWDDVIKLAHDFEATEPELSARAFAYVLRNAGEAATDERKISADLVKAFRESQHKLLLMIGGLANREAIIEELAPETWRWWIVGRKILNVDLQAKEAEDYFKETTALLRFLSDARPYSADLVKYLTDALDWYAIAATRSGGYAQLPLAARLAPIFAAERLVSLDPEGGPDRMGEAAAIFFKQIWDTDAQGRPLYGAFLPGLTVADLSDAMARVVRNDRDLLDTTSAAYNAVIRNFAYLLGTVRLSAQAAAGAVQDCDRAAASPLDPWRTAPGVPPEDMNADAAIAACKAAIDKSDQPRFDFQLGLAYNLKASQDPDNAAAWRSKERAAFAKAFNRGYAAAIGQLAVGTYAEVNDENHKQEALLYKQAFFALYARYIVVTARPIVDSMVANGSARDHAAGARFLLEQAISYGDIDSELSLADLIASGSLPSSEPLERVTRVLIALRLGSADAHKRAAGIWQQIKPDLSEDDQQRAEREANRFVAGPLPVLPEGMAAAYLSLKLDEPPKNN